MEICKAVTPCVDTPANTHNNQNVRACQRQRSRGGRLDRKHGCITVCDRPGRSTSGVARTTGSVAISCNGPLRPATTSRTTVSNTCILTVYGICINILSSLLTTPNRFKIKKYENSNISKYRTKPQLLLLSTVKTKHPSYQVTTANNKTNKASIQLLIFGGK